MILGRKRRVRGVVVVTVVAESRRVVLDGVLSDDGEGFEVDVRLDVEVGVGLDIVWPVNAVHIASMGGVGSDQGTVNRGLSQRLFVEGSS